MQALQALLPADFLPQLPLAVGYSGGADSTALLLACYARWPGQVRAIHVNHGLQAAAAAFEVHCEQICQMHGIPLQVARLRITPQKGQSPEDAARRTRWQALVQACGAQTEQCETFSAIAHASIEFVATKTEAFKCPSIALAQHAQDQSETVLLALSRGAGLGGLSGMPRVAQRDGLVLHRPLLEVPPERLRQALRENAIAWIEDPSNADARFTRNRIRAALPALHAALPGFDALASRSARHIAQAQSLLADLAEIDLAQTGIPPRIQALQSLSHDRQANALRHWLKTQHHTQASSAQLSELQSQLAACTTRGHGIDIQVGSGRIRRDRETLCFKLEMNPGVAP